MSKTLGLSVVIPNYNHSSFLREAVESCLNQTRKADEIILIDDRSTDDSWEIMEDFARRFPSVKIFRNEENEGVVYCMNKGAKKQLEIAFSSVPPTTVFCLIPFQRSGRHLSKNRMQLLLSVKQFSFRTIRG